MKNRRFFALPGFSTQLKKTVPLTVILLLHVGLFIALQNGLLHQTSVAAPKEVMVSLITPPAAIQAPTPQPTPVKEKPKTVAIVKKSVPRPLPVIEKASTETVAAAPPSPAPPAAPAAPAAPTSVATASPPPPRTVSGVEYLRPPSPQYPSAAKRRGEEGQVTFRILVSDKGAPEQITLQKSSGSTQLDEAARQAVQRALFKPYIDNGQAVAVYVIVPIKFQLNA
ncbi:TonB family protein [Herbaspirillum sp. RTI4]|uniref:energy transducer TonB n=1 Tax=Herbaspirillum sp. RTI4 TaxID=3048640 RepID=UPI002AB4A876|nr:TonB family protein [Herbaspirillum sp. RTI4]MDY7579420.1 TonB family protein [Herbaspirillum sp. RTI4]MEA9980334.1 TonB family protein [Herbaspirillum sp. RTI4]